MKRPDLLVIADPEQQRRAVDDAGSPGSPPRRSSCSSSPCSPSATPTSGGISHSDGSSPRAASRRTSRSASCRPHTSGSASSGCTKSLSPALSVPAAPALRRWSWGSQRLRRWFSPHPVGAASIARISGPWLALAMVITGVVLTSVAGVSSGVISVLGVAIVLFVVSRWREGRTAAVWGLPPLFLLWANMDAGFAAGLLILVGALLIIRPVAGHASGGRRQLGAALAVSAVAALANPVGPGIYASVLSGSLQPRRGPGPRGLRARPTSTSGGRGSSKPR